MSWSDLAIIYLACGAPVGVHFITRREKIPVPRAAASFIFWPVFVVLILTGCLTREEISSSAAEQIRCEIEQLAFHEGSSVALFEFRDVFSRYEGLSEIVRLADNNALDRNAELFAAMDRKSASLATRCAARRNNSRLIFHQERARQEFVELIAEIAAADDRVIELALRLADQVGDHDARRAISQIGGRERTPAKELRAASRV